MWPVFGLYESPWKEEQENIQTLKPKYSDFLLLDDSLRLKIPFVKFYGRFEGYCSDYPAYVKVYKCLALFLAL